MLAVYQLLQSQWVLAEQVLATIQLLPTVELAALVHIVVPLEATVQTLIIHIRAELAELVQADK
jgi:hypothetical protein